MIECNGNETLQQKPVTSTSTSFRSYHPIQYKPNHRSLYQPGYTVFVSGSLMSQIEISSLYGDIDIYGNTLVAFGSSDGDYRVSFYTIQDS